MNSFSTSHPAVAAQVPGSILIVEDHPLYAEGLMSVMSARFHDMNLVVWQSVEAALKGAWVQTDLKLVLLDIGLPGISGARAVAALKQAFRHIPLVVNSASESRSDATAAFQAGAGVFISKAVSMEVLIDTISRALTTNIPPSTWITPSACSQLLESAIPRLSGRQSEILALICKGYSNKEIALCLNIAEVTVKLHVSAVLRMLDVTNRTQAALTASRLGFFRNDAQKNIPSADVATTTCITK